jgi:hypothetical protein
MIARLRCWLYIHLQFRLNLHTSVGYHCKISLITTGWDCFGCQVIATLRAMRRLIGWRAWARTPTSMDQSLVFHCQFQLSGIWIESGSLTHTLNTGAHLTAVNNPSFGLNTQSVSSLFLSRSIFVLKNIFIEWDWQQALFVHLANWKRRRHFTLCVSVRLLLLWEHAFLASPYWMRQNIQRSRHPQSCSLISKADDYRQTSDTTLLNMYVDFFSLSFCFCYSIFFRLISLFTSHLGEQIRPKQRPAVYQEWLHPSWSIHPYKLIKT